MDEALPRQVDTVIVGNGPSALILSYILHGHIPVYDLSSPHPDNLLHEKLKSSKDLLSLDVRHLTGHFAASRFSYSTQALPINVLLDTLIRPYGETDEVGGQTCVKWQYDHTRVVPHIVVGQTNQSGGIWVDNPVQASWDIGTLSYAGMLSLPAYTFAAFYLERYGKQMPSYLRPSRREVAAYFAIYPSKVGISDSVYNNERLSNITRTDSGFYIKSHGVSCNHLVLASGTFTSLIQPPPSLWPLASLPDFTGVSSFEPILVVGSGFSAADVIISTPISQKIIHVYKWTPSVSPSPLRGCHQQAYPEYAAVYRKMKLAAVSAGKPSNSTPSQRLGGRRASSAQCDLSRDWSQSYEGLPNTTISNVELNSDEKSATVTFQNNTLGTFKRKISSLAFVVGRRGSLQYLETALQKEICPTLESLSTISGYNMREQANEDLEVTNDVFIAGSLTGDTLVRFAYGGCVYAAGKILQRKKTIIAGGEDTCGKCHIAAATLTTMTKHGQVKGSGHNSNTNMKYIQPMTGYDGHRVSQKFCCEADRARRWSKSSIEDSIQDRRGSLT